MKLSNRALRKACCRRAERAERRIVDAEVERRAPVVEAGGCVQVCKVCTGIGLAKANSCVRAPCALINGDAIRPCCVCARIAAARAVRLEAHAGRNCCVRTPKASGHGLARGDCGFCRAVFALAVDAEALLLGCAPFALRTRATDIVRIIFACAASKMHRRAVVELVAPAAVLGVGDALHLIESGTEDLCRLVAVRCADVSVLALNAAVLVTQRTVFVAH